jgi:hypothetical protein
MSLANFVQADLRFLLPVQAEQQVAIVGYVPELVEAVREVPAYGTLLLTGEAVETPPALPAYDQRQIEEESLPLRDASIDHLFVPQLATSMASWLLEEVSRVLRPGGWLFLGVHNRFSLHRIWLRQQSQYALTWSGLKEMFPADRWQHVQCYGIHENLQSPQYLVSLTIPEISRYFYEQLFVPHSQVAAWGQRLALGLSRMGSRGFLFRDLGLVAQQL